MKIEIKVVPGARKNLVKTEEGRLKVYLTAPAVEGKANKALIEALAQHFKVAKKDIQIIKGLQSRSKIINIESI